MSSILLVVHIVLAVLTVGISVAVVWAPLRAARRVAHMWHAFYGVVGTGLGLVLVHPGSLGKVCLLTTVYIVGLAAVTKYQRYAVARASIN